MIFVVILGLHASDKKIVTYEMKKHTNHMISHNDFLRIHYRRNHKIAMIYTSNYYPHTMRFDY